LGANGSGAAVIAQRLLAVTGLRVTTSTGSLEATADRLRDRTLEAFFWSGGVPTPALRTLHEQIGIRIVPLAGQLPALRARYGTAYQEIRLPAGGYGQAGVPTIGVANLLLCHENLPGDVAAAVARTLVTRASRLVPTQEVGVQLLDPRALIGTLGVPLHPGAATTYRELHE
jgi:TRAP transporter TAXI family solute receptor